MFIVRASVTDMNVRRPIRAGPGSGAKVTRAQYTSLVHRHTSPPVFINVRVSDNQFVFFSHPQSQKSIHLPQQSPNQKTK